MWRRRKRRRRRRRTTTTQKDEEKKAMKVHVVHPLQRQTIYIYLRHVKPTFPIKKGLLISTTKATILFFFVFSEHSELCPKNNRALNEP